MCDQVPPELVVNVDERVLNMVPVSECSCEKESATQVPVAAIDDKCQITCVMAVSLDKSLLSPQ